MSSFTPGPWHGMRDGRFSPTDWHAEVEDASMSAAAPIVDDNGKTVALIVSNVWKDAEMYANVELVKTAPDLLAALIGVVRVADRATDEFDAARAAIAKATGGQP